MMKRIFALLLALLLALASCAMAQTEQPILRSVYESNQLEAVFQTCQTVSCDADYFGSDGEVTTKIHLSRSADGAILYTHSDGYVEYLDRESIFYHDPESGEISQFAFLSEDQYADRVSEFFSSFVMGYSETEQVLEDTVDGAARYLTTIMPVLPEQVESFPEGAGEIHQQWQYELDAQNLRVVKVTGSVIIDGVTTKLNEVSYSYSDELAAKPQFVLDMIASGTRTVTLHEGDQVRTLTAYKGYPVQFAIPDGLAVFADAHRTPMGELNLNADQEIYLLPAEQ